MRFGRILRGFKDFMSIYEYEDIIDLLFTHKPNFYRKSMVLALNFVLISVFFIHSIRNQAFFGHGPIPGQWIFGEKSRYHLQRTGQCDARIKFTYLPQVDVTE